MILALVSLVVIVAMAMVVVGSGRRRAVKLPAETTADDAHERTDTTSTRFYEGADRPAGPDAEDPTTP